MISDRPIFLKVYHSLGLKTTPSRNEFRTGRTLANSTSVFLALTAAVSAAATQTPSVRAPSLVATLNDRRVQESSGLAASRRTPGVYWTHNDSGSGPHLFATDSRGRALARVTVSGSRNVDWEDLASGPGPDGGAALFIADFGDNSRSRRELVLYRVEEPAIDLTRERTELTTMTAHRFPFKYPDGPHDAETLLVIPTSGEICVVTKSGDGQSGVYRFPQPLARDRLVTLEKVATVSFGMTINLPGRLGRFERLQRMATGGAISPDGRKIAIQTYTEVYEWALRPDETVPAALARKPSRTPLLIGQSEGLCYAPDGGVYLTTEGRPCRLWRIPPAGKNAPAR